MITFTNAIGQSNNKRGNRQWIQYNSQLTVSEKTSLAFDLGLRWQNKLKDRAQHIIRGRVNYELNNNALLFTGLATLGFYNQERLDRREIRPFQGIQYRNQFKSFFIQHRVQAEQRMFRHLQENRTSWDHRFRYRAMAVFGLKELTEDEGLGINMNVGGELFVTAQKNMGNNMFNHDRLLLGTTISFSDKLATSVNYFHDFVRANSELDYRQNDIIMLIIRQRFGS
ncbi:MAG: DUF2490 domain-containing protein [Cyclobacteriaceae bacterium]